MDDLLDLDWSKQSGSNLAGGQKGTKGTNSYNGPDAGNGTRNGGGMSSYNFDALTRSMPSSGNPLRSQQQQTNSIKSPTTQSKSGNDAFSSLLGFDSTSSNNNNGKTTLTMAERMKQSNGQTLNPTIASQTRGTHSPSITSRQQIDTAWDGLDDFMNGSSSSSSSSSKNNGSASNRDMNRQPLQAARTTTKNSVNDDDLWNFSNPTSNKQQYSAKPSISQRSSPAPSVPLPDAKKNTSKDPFDFSEFEDPADYQSSALGGGSSNDLSIEKNVQARKEHTDSFNRRGGNASLLGDSSMEEEDSILGSLGRPAKPLSETFDSAFADEEGPIPNRSRTGAGAKDRKSGASSPPPHIIGQVVEMGFSPQQARDALSQTSSGQNVQEALEILLQGSREHSTRNISNATGRDTGDERDRKLAMRLQREEESHRSGHTRGEDETGFSRKRQDGQNDSRSDTPVDWQKQADQLYAQASVLGANMFSKANALWSTAKSQAQRALDERNGGSAAGSLPDSGRSSPATGSDRARNRRWAVPSRDGGARKEWQGKPKWMVDAENEDQDAPGVERNLEPDANKIGKKQNSFKDDFEGEEDQAPPFFERSQALKEKAKVQEHSDASTNVQSTSADLWGSTSEEGKRPLQRKPSPVENVQGSKKAHASSWLSDNRSAMADTSKTLKESVTKRQRRLVADEAGAVQIASKHKQHGNELFKRGAYGEAEVAYGAALNALDANPRSIRRVILLNNRANARLKNGDAKGALDDTLAILRLIVVEEGEKSSPFLLFRPSQEAPLPLPEYAEVNLREGYAKALLRRAQAEEMLERWDPALSVWSLLEKYEREEGSGANGVTNMRAAKEGKGRCDKMLKGGDINGTIAQEPKAINNVRVRAAAASAVAKAEAKVKERLRAENAAVAQEEATKDSLRDSVDGRILAWKNGKENNVRALLASLHDIVWPGLGWKKVGMHELVMDNQVKKVYMRAIGRLHPDKLTPKSNTIEERMLGGAVFTVLNDAWSSSQST